MIKLIDKQDYIFVTKYWVNHIEDDSVHYHVLPLTNNLLFLRKKERKKRQNKEKSFISYQNLVLDSYRL